MTHFLLALVVLAGAIIVALEGRIHARGLAEPVGPSWLRTVATVGVAACAALVVTGTVASASGLIPAGGTFAGSASASRTPCTSTCAPPPSTGSGF